MVVTTFLLQTFVTVCNAEAVRGSCMMQKQCCRPSSSHGPQQSQSQNRTLLHCCRLRCCCSEEVMDAAVALFDTILGTNSSSLWQLYRSLWADLRSHVSKNLCIPAPVQQNHLFGNNFLKTAAGIDQQSTECLGPYLYVLTGCHIWQPCLHDGLGHHRLLPEHL